MAMTVSRDGLSSMKRSQLQKLCKQHHLRGNLKTTELVDLLVDHFERQDRSASERTVASPAPVLNPQGPVRSRDENRELSPSIRQQQAANFVLHEQQPRPTNILHLDPATISLDINTLEQQLAQGNVADNPPPSTSQRIATLESICTRLLAHATTTNSLIADLRSRLETAESSIANLTGTLEDTRTQLANANSEIVTLRASSASSEQRFTDTATNLKSEMGTTKQLAESLGSRLTHAEEKWTDIQRDVRRRTAEPDDMFLFEPPNHPRSSSRSDRGRSKEPGGFTVSWADHQQALAGGLVPPAVRLFGAGSSGLRASSHDAEETDEERPGTSSSIRTRFGPGGPVVDSRSASAHPSSWSSTNSIRKMGVNEGSLAQDAATVISLSSKAAGKRPASPIPIPTDPHRDTFDTRATKRSRHETRDAAGGQSDESSSHKSSSISAGASVSTVDSPMQPHSPTVEPSTPPNRRTTLLLPPVEIITTPSPSRPVAGRREPPHIESHGFATTPKPPIDYPMSPTLESPRRGLNASARKDSQLLRMAPLGIDSPIKVIDRLKKREKVREPSILSSKIGSASPATLVIGKGKAVGASVDHGTATAEPPSRSNSVEAPEDVVMQDAAGPSTSTQKKRSSVTPPAVQKDPDPPTAPGLTHSSKPRRQYNFFAPPQVPPVPSSVSRLNTSQLSVPKPSGLSRWGTSPGLLPGDKPRFQPPAMVKDYGADPDEMDISPNKALSSSVRGGLDATSSSSAAGWTRMWGR